MKENKPIPPSIAKNILLWFLKDELMEEVEGDLEENYYKQLSNGTVLSAKLNYWKEVLLYFRPFALRPDLFTQLNPFFMWRHHFKISWRTLHRNKGYSFINIGGLAIGMAVAMLLGLWVQDEISFNTYHENYDKIARVVQHRKINNEIQTWFSMPFPMGEELKEKYGDNFKHVVKCSSWTRERHLEYDDEEYLKSGDFIESDGIEMLTPNMIYGDWKALEKQSSIMISRSLAETIFGTDDAMGKVMKLDKNFLVTVTGVYEDFPGNSQYENVDYFASWDVYLAANQWIKELGNPWGNNSFRLLVELAPNKTFEEVSQNIKASILNNVTHDPGAFISKPEVFLLPMKDWYLNSNFSNGVQMGGRIQYVWLFGMTGFFVLFLACINFINLSTARSEKRAKEVGVRKAIGSKRGQLINQFFSESILVVFLSFLIGSSLVQFALPWFNDIADKNIALPLDNPLFWISSLLFILFTGLIAGSYPALFLSSFQPINTLKGTFYADRRSSLPRKILVVVQFTVSISLIIGTIMVYQQIQHAQGRPIGYNQDNLAMITMLDGNVRPKFDVIEDELKKANVITEMALSRAPITRVWTTNGGLEWTGKDPESGADFPFTGVSHNYGKTIGWEFVKGRDFRKELAKDSTAVIVNEAAIRVMQLENPIGEIVRVGPEWPLTIIGVVKDILIESPYQPIRPHFYHIADDRGSVLNFKLNPAISANESMRIIESTIKTQVADSRFNFHFVDEVFNGKFESEKRLAKLSGIFATLAILISCLGLFGLASFVAERRNKEISIRKILGASILNLWGMLSKDFILLVFVSFIIAIPLSYYFIYDWLGNYEYRVDISWWIFAVAGFGAIVITLFTVSFQAIKAALANPVNALKQE